RRKPSSLPCQPINQNSGAFDLSWQSIEIGILTAGVSAASSRTEAIKAGNQMCDIGNVAGPSRSRIERLDFFEAEVLTNGVELLQQIVVSFIWRHCRNAVGERDLCGRAWKILRDDLAHLCASGFLLLFADETQIATHDDPRRDNIRFARCSEALVCDFNFSTA